MLSAMSTRAHLGHDSCRGNVVVPQDPQLPPTRRGPSSAWMNSPSSISRLFVTCFLLVPLARVRPSSRYPAMRCLAQVGEDLSRVLAQSRSTPGGRDLERGQPEGTRGHERSGLLVTGDGFEEVPRREVG